MKLPIRTLLLATLVAIPLLAPASANAAKKMEVATQDDGVFIFNQDIGREAALRAARNMGVTHLRLNILWWQAVPPGQRNDPNVPSNIVYNFAPWDVAIAR